MDYEARQICMISLSGVTWDPSDLSVFFLFFLPQSYRDCDRNRGWTITCEKSWSLMVGRHSRWACVCLIGWVEALLWIVQEAKLLYKGWS